MNQRALAHAVLALITASLAARAWSGSAAPAGLTPATEANYMLNCMGCHRPDGAGSPGKVPSVRDSLAPLAASAAGRRYLVAVPGAAQSLLSDRELAQLLSWMVRTLSTPAAPPGFEDFTASEVARYRRTPLIEVRAERTRLLGNSLERARSNGSATPQQASTRDNP
jgi:mono/diheme cytochrome c family protein